MKIKKITALLLAGIMAASMVGCGNDSGGKNQSVSKPAEDKSSAVSNDDQKEAVDMNGKLVVWTLSDDLKTFGEKFVEMYPDVELETVVIAPAEYPTKVQSALLGGAKEPDVIVGEPQMLGNMYEAEFFEDLDQAPYNAQDYAGEIVDYVWKVGQDEEGVQRAISYQITPAGIYYRRDIAKTVFGTDDPAEIGKKFANYDTIRSTGQELKDAGYRIFASDAEISYFSGDSAWVIDDKLNVDQGRFDYMDLCVDLYKNDLTAFASQWAAPWYQAMSGPVPILTADTQWGTDDMNIWDEESFKEATKDAETTEVFAFGLPAWGVLTMRDHVEDTSGLWGICAGPSYGFGGGTFIGISSNSERKDLAWEFVKFCTLDEEISDWWIEVSEGDTVSLLSSLAKHKDDQNEVYGGEKLYSFWLDQAKGIDYTKVTKYDKAIDDAWGSAISSIKSGEATKDDAIKEFYDVVASTYPELAIEK